MEFSIPLQEQICILKADKCNSLNKRVRDANCCQNAFTERVSWRENLNVRKLEHHACSPTENVAMKQKGFFLIA